MNSTLQSERAPKRGSVAAAWLRALELTAPIAAQPNRVLLTAIEEIASVRGNTPALVSDRETITYGDLIDRVNRYARWALDQQLAKGDVVCLLMPNRPEYLAIWLGITSVGAVASLLNVNLSGTALAHCIRIGNPKKIIVGSECLESLASALRHIESTAETWVHGASSDGYPSIDRDIARRSGNPLAADERPPLTIDDLALQIYTSGTTGLPKAARVSHARLMQWTHWFRGMMDVQPDDRMYNCLPMYHSVGGVQAPGAVLAGGGTVVIRDRFSVSNFWNDIQRWDCTLFQYIGELCRYLLQAAPASSASPEHRIRLACGNGLAPGIWDEFKERFRIPHILEFYAATEGNISLFNVQEKRGAIGHIPGFLAHRFGPALVRFDVETEQPFRNAAGFCVRCETNEVGEALGQLGDSASQIGRRFEGYTSQGDSEKKILREVFAPGDAWVRTGDLMRRDEEGFFYFVDRVGDTFRRKGENVATSEVSAAICEFPGVDHASVFGVSMPGVDGRAGMAALVTDDQLDMAELRKHIVRRLPHYARPLFLRICVEAEVTTTFKYSKTHLMRQGYDPLGHADPLYFDDPKAQAYVQLDANSYEKIQNGELRL
jgi:fatty-acyl-CoA synthase